MSVRTSKRAALKAISHFISYTISRVDDETGCDYCGAMLCVGDKVTQTETGEKSFCSQSCGNQYLYKHPVDDLGGEAA